MIRWKRSKDFFVPEVFRRWLASKLNWKWSEGKN